MSQLELRVPPVVVLCLAALAMWLIARASPTSPLDLELRFGIAATLGLAGFALAAAGVREFRVARTTVNPLQPGQAASIVTSGIYRHTRNPMYLGMLLLLAGWGAALGRTWPLLALPVFVAYLNRFQIRPEERALEQRFGAEFSGYAARVRRWL
jgi:protein-S-isoprenylcysteine O-methyltransferase Ste14